MVALDGERGERLAAAVRQSLRELDLTVPEASRKSELSVAAIDRIINRRSDSVSERTLYRLERGLDWQEGSAERVMAGKSPLPIEGGSPTGRPRAVVRELDDERGRLVRRIDIFVDSTRPEEGATEDRERWIEIWDALAAQSPARARGALRIAETLLLFPETTDPDEW